jgi:hypothetical protein
MNTALEYSTRVVQEGGRRCKSKSTLNDLVHLTPLRIPLMNPLYVFLWPAQRAQQGGKQHKWGYMDMTQSTDTQKKTRYSLSLSLSLPLSLSLSPSPSLHLSLSSLSSILRIVEVRSAAKFLSAQAQFRSLLPAD